MKSFMIKKKESFLNFPNISKTFTGLDCCFLDGDRVVILNSANELQIESYSSVSTPNKVVTLNRNVSKIFNSNKINETVIVFEDGKIAIMNSTNSSVKIRAIVEEEVLDIVFGFENIAILSQKSVLLLN